MVGKHTENCMICGGQLVYSNTTQNMSCHFCKKHDDVNVICENGHYVCDSCHADNGISFITKYVKETKSKNPIIILTEIMKNITINMHGPEHHYLVVATLLSAYKNADGEIELDKALKSAEQRAKNVPGGVCGLWGSCGAGIASGIFISIITDATPLSEKEWAFANKMTSKSLNTISENGGPRCCKRNSYIAIIQAATFIKDNFGIMLEMPEQVSCIFSYRNKQCKKDDCLFFNK